MNADAPESDRLPIRRPARLPAAMLAWGVLGAVVCAIVAPLEPNLLEEGLMLEIAQRIVHGQRLYQDVVAFTGPLPFEALALGFSVFGEEIWVARGLVVALHGAATAAVFVLARATRRDGLEHLATAWIAFAPVLLFPLLSTYFYTTVAVSVGIVASAATLPGVRDARWAVAAGVLVASTALCKQTIGAILAIGLLPVIAACAAQGSRLRQPVAFAAGGILTAVVTLAAFAATGGVGMLTYSLVYLPLAFEPSFDSPMMNFWPPGVFSETIEKSQVFYLPYYYSLFYHLFHEPSWLTKLGAQIVYALPFLGIVATALCRIRGPLPTAVWVHLVTLVAMTSNVFPRADWGHLVAALPSAAVQLTLLLPSPGERASQGTRIGAWAGIASIALASLALGTLLYRVSIPPTFGPRVPLRVVNTGSRGQSLPSAIRYIRNHTHPGDAIFVARAEPLIYFATDTRNPTPYGGVIPGMNEEQQRVILEALETTRFVVMSDLDQPVFTYYRDELPAVQKALERHYRIPDDYLGDGRKWIQVLERGPDRGATHFDLIDDFPEAEGWVYARDGSRVPAARYRGKIAVAQNRRFLPFFIGHGGGGIDFELEIPENARLQTSVGYRIALGSDMLHEHHPQSRMRISIGDGESFRVLREVELSLRRGDIRRWRPIDLDLSEYAGRSVTLRLEQIPARPIRGLRLGWWGSPRIAVPPAATNTDDPAAAPTATNADDPAAAPTATNADDPAGTPAAKKARDPAAAGGEETG